jgi:NAD(P)-dependent dehydrogenase (short-subunit alcohol dehydrogenase family)
MQTILITGGNGTMARQIVKNFANEYSFLLLDIHEKISTEITTKNVTYFQCDICNIGELKKIEKTISESNFQIVAIINNAAVDFVPSLETVYQNEYSPEIAMNVLNVNVIGAINVIEVFKNLIIQSKGSVINISSIYSKVPPDQAIYSDLIGADGEQFKKPIYYGLSKSALNYVTKYYVNDLAKDDVKINTIIFGGIEANQPNLFKNKYIKKVPLKRMGNWCDVINVFKFLLLVESNYITGNEILVEGGFLCFK